VAGKIALIDRGGGCAFTIKTKNAQLAGAVGVVIVNNVVDPSGSPLGMSGSDPTITIPAYSITLALGTTIKSSGTVNATLGYANIGVNQGCVRMFAPNPLVPGSSVSHFHSDASPDLLMEPALNTSIFNHVDLTLPLFADIDWSVNNLDDFAVLRRLRSESVPARATVTRVTLRWRSRSVGLPAADAIRG